MDKKNILITGACGYVGAMLVKQFNDRDDIEKIVCVDKEQISEMIAGLSKVEFKQTNLINDDWQEWAKEFKPEIIIHTAWQIRQLPDDSQYDWNIKGSQNVFDFVFQNDFAKRIVYFSTVASYAAQKDNTIEHNFTEDEPFRESEYFYAEEKRIVEENLKKIFEENKDKQKKVFIIRPAAITGPRGRYMRVRFGLQSALSGQLKKEKNIWMKLVTKLVSFTPITKKWVRQFIHEDDIVDIVELLSFDSETDNDSYEIFNAAPSGDVVRGKDMAKAVGKKPIMLHPQMIRFAFFLMRNLSGGKIPTSKGGWKSYSYPIVVDGSKITKKYGFQYKMGSLEAFSMLEGRYADIVKEKYLNS